MSLKRQRTHQPTPFQIKKEIRRGKLQKYAKGAAVGVRAGLPAQAARLRLVFGAEIGLDFGVKSHHRKSRGQASAFSLVRRAGIEPARLLDKGF